MRYTGVDLKFLREEGEMLADTLSSDKVFINEISQIGDMKNKIIYVANRLKDQGYENLDDGLVANTIISLGEKKLINMSNTGCYFLVHYALKNLTPQGGI